MAQVLSGNTIKLNNGQTIQANQGGWYDGQQFWGGTLSQPGQINAQSNQQGAGQQVSNEVIAQTNPNNVAYIQSQQQKAGITPTPSMPTASQAPGGNAGSGAGGTGAIGLPQAPTINLPDLYNKLYASTGVQDKLNQLTQYQKDYADATSKINDNPFLSEATRIGKIAKLDQLYQQRTAGLRDEVATAKADIETQLNLQTKQFDINSQQAKDALAQFNTLLESGALAGASGEDIANITRSTGLSSSMIQSAIQANQAKNVKTETIKYDDGTNQGYAIVNTQTGEIISKQAIAASEPKKKTGGAAATKASEKEQNTANLITSIKNKITLKSLVNAFSGVLSIDEIYRLYNQYSPYGQAKETLSEIKQGKYKI